MKKKKLIAEMNLVIEKNNKLFNKCQELENLLNEKINQIDELTASVAEVAAENELLKAELKSAAYNILQNGREPLNTADTLEMLANINNDCVDVDFKNKEEEPVKVSTSYTIEDIKPVECSTAFIAEEKIKVASKSIGRVVLECTKLCNTFATIGDINSKDLINLALGRTEVFKSEVLQLATDGKTANSIECELNSKEQAVFEYFELLKNQT